MKSKMGILLFWILLSSTTLVAQENNWTKATNWKIYDINKRMAFQYPLDSLFKLKFIKLDDKRVSSFLANAYALDNEKGYVWMNLYVATCELDSSNFRKVIFSNYGGFFYDEKTKRYFELPENIRREWLDYLNEKVTELNEK